jgi:hypothetical protein
MHYGHRHIPHSSSTVETAARSMMAKQQSSPVFRFDQGPSHICFDFHIDCTSDHGLFTLGVVRCKDISFYQSAAAFYFTIYNLPPHSLSVPTLQEAASSSFSSCLEWAITVHCDYTPGRTRHALQLQPVDPRMLQPSYALEFYRTRVF